MTGARLDRTVQRFILDQPVDVPCTFGGGSISVYGLDRQVFPDGHTSLLVDAQRITDAGGPAGSRCTRHVDDTTSRQLEALLPPEDVTA